jgi:hypothetical protein
MEVDWVTSYSICHYLSGNTILQLVYKLFMKKKSRFYIHEKGFKINGLNGNHD